MNVTQIQTGTVLWTWDVSTYRVWTGTATPLGSRRVLLTASDSASVEVEGRDVYATAEEARVAARAFAACMAAHYRRLVGIADAAAQDRIYERDAEFAEDTNAARRAIVAHLGGPWKKGMAGSQGVIDCPVCKAAKSLRFSRAGYNGHIHAACQTADCVSWME